MRGLLGYPEYFAISYVRFCQIGMMLVNSGDNLIRQQSKWMVAEIGDKDSERFPLFYVMHAGHSGAVVFCEQTFVWFD